MPIMKKFIKTPDINGIVASNSAASSSEPKGNQSTVSPAKSSSVPMGNGSPGLGTKAVRRVKKIFGVRAEGSKEKEPGKPIVLSENPTPIRPMSINKIKDSLKTAIKNCRVDLIVNRIGNNFELVNNAVNSKDTVTMELLKKAIDLISRDDRSTIFHLIAHKGDKAKILELFLDLDSVKVIKIIDTVTNKAGKTAKKIAVERGDKEFLEVVDNARAKLEEAKKQEKKEVVDNAREKKKSSSVSQKADANPKKRPQSVAPQVTNLNRSDSSTLNDLTEENLTIEEIRLELERFIKNESSGDILNFISDNHETIKKSIEKSDDTGLMELILQAAYDVKDAGIEKTAYEMAKEQNNLIFQEVVQNASDKLVELRKKDENFLTLTYFEETDEIYEEQEMRSVKSCSDLTTLGSAPSVEEGGKNNEGEAPPDVTEEGGDHESIGILKFSKSEENFLSWSDFDILPTNGNNIKTPTKSTLELSIDQDLHESDSDDSGMGGSPVSSPKKEGMKSPQSSRRNSLLSNTGSDTEEISNPQTKSKTPPKPTLRTSLQKQPDKKVSSALTEAEPTPVVTPVLEAGIQEKQDRLIPVSATRVTLPPQEKGPALDAAKAPDRVTKEPKVIKPEEEKENILRVKRQSAASRNSDKGTPLEKQSNNRNVCFAAIAICTLGAIACFATASIYIMSAKKANPVFSTSSIAVIGALFLIGIGFAATAGITWCLTPPPPLSELTSTDSTRQAAKSRE